MRMCAFHTYNFSAEKFPALNLIEKEVRGHVVSTLSASFRRKGVISTFRRRTSTGCHLKSLPPWVSALTTGVLTSKHPCEANNNGIWETRPVFPRLPSLWTTARRCSQGKIRSAVVKCIWRMLCLCLFSHRIHLHTRGSEWHAVKTQISFVGCLLKLFYHKH